MDSRRKNTQQMLGALLAEVATITAAMHSSEEQTMLGTIKNAQCLSQSRLNSACGGASTMAQSLIEAAISKREDEAIDSLVRTLTKVIRDKHRGFKVSINVARSST